MGGAVGDYNNDGWPDMVITCLGHEVLYRNNGDGTFTDVTKQAGIDDPRWSTGAAFGDYDNDGFVDLMVTRYVDFQLSDLPQFGSSPTCKYRGIDVQCGPRGLARRWRFALSQQRRRHLHRCFQSSRRGRRARLLRPRRAVVRLRQQGPSRHLRRRRLDSEVSLSQRRQRQVHRHRSRVRHGGERRRLRAGLDGHRARRLQTHRPALALRHQLRRRIQHPLPQPGRLRFSRCFLRRGSRRGSLCHG